MTMELATGYPNMRNAAYIPDIFSKAVRANLNAHTCLPQISQAGYLGEVKNVGQVVKIPSVPRVYMADYARGQEIEIKTDAATALELTIDRQFYWDQYWDDMDLHQTHLAMLEAATAKQAAAQVAARIEAAVFAGWGALVPAANTGTAAGKQTGLYNTGTAAAPTQLTKKNALAWISQFFSILAEQDISDGDGTKSVVIPEWARFYLVNTDDLKDASKIGEKSSLRTNRLGNLYGIEVYTSTLLTGIPVNGQTYKAWPFLACAKSALNFCAAMNKVETVRPAKMFGTLAKGLVLWGFGTPRPEGLSIGYAYPGDSTILSAT